MILRALEVRKMTQRIPEFLPYESGVIAHGLTTQNIGFSRIWRTTHACIARIRRCAGLSTGTSQPVLPVGHWGDIGTIAINLSTAVEGGCFGL